MPKSQKPKRNRLDPTTKALFELTECALNQHFADPDNLVAYVAKVLPLTTTDHTGRVSIAVLDTWPPGLPVFSLMTPFPSTPLYQRLLAAGRLTRPKHWLELRPFTMSYTPDNITIAQAEAEVREAWTRAYNPKATMEALRRISDRPLSERAIVFFARLAFRGIYFPQVRARQWFSLLWGNRRVLLSLCYEASQNVWRRRPRSASPRQEAA